MMEAVLLTLWCVFQIILLNMVFKANSRMWYYRGRRDSYQHMLEDIDEWRKKHPGMNVDDHWEVALGLHNVREHNRQNELND